MGAFLFYDVSGRFAAARMRITLARSARSVKARGSLSDVALEHLPSSIGAASTMAFVGGQNGKQAVQIGFRMIGAEADSQSGFATRYGWRADGGHEHASLF